MAGRFISKGMNNTPPPVDALHLFDDALSVPSAPDLFTYPFCYEPSDIARKAAAQVQEFLCTGYNNEHNFGLDPDHQGLVIGKMFGVLVVETSDGRKGFLAAYSGKLADGKQHPYFVPPVFDIFKQDGLYLTETKEVTALNNEIEALESSEEYTKRRGDLLVATEQGESELSTFKLNMSLWKKERDRQRNEGLTTLTEAEFLLLEAQLKDQSIKQKVVLKHLQKRVQERINGIRAELQSFEERLELMREKRRTRSAWIQSELFNSYRFLNAKGEWKSLLSLFNKEMGIDPPAGAGECAAPKLLQYAFQHKLKPLALAEFWWGQSPKSEIRKHGEYYPACRSKCLPILSWMMQGLTVDDNPLQANPAEGREMEIIYEDEEVLVINKPAEFLSVPGRYVSDSVQTRVKAMYPDAILVHRLDQGTSGIIVAGKSFESYLHLQKQFVKRSVEKRYIALLEGDLKQEEGIIDLPLRTDIDNRPYQMVCYEHGKPAQTRFSVLSRQGGRTLIRFYPITGRTHQLRMHSAHPLGLNIPIVGDDLYGSKDTRLHLHAEYLSFVHPRSQERVVFEVRADFDIAK